MLTTSEKQEIAWNFAQLLLDDTGRLGEDEFWEYVYAQITEYSHRDQLDLVREIYTVLWDSTELDFDD